ncbi:hypothetical protein RZ532_03050 [Nitratireductor aquimarinus]|uniref:DUF6949 family protein n=1 Tax=Nitratireductor aquimarinus TaxID=889300 RepID=UPI00293605BD|nr:hypothetical protein [Nitratireductor aquimarinus]MDV2964937.1 hypothetical protein [Nitratireductor aquimarinus]
MVHIWLCGAAFVAGLVFCGLSSSLFELLTGRRVRFQSPFIVRRRVLRSLAVMLCVGPVVFLREALASHRQRLIGHGALAGAAFKSGLWVTATGVVVIEAVLAVGRI